MPALVCSASKCGVLRPHRPVVDADVVDHAREVGFGGHGVAGADITGGELQPSDSLARAKNRAWVEFASNMLGNLYMMKMSKDEERYNKYRDTLVDQLHRIDKRLGDGPWFNGDEFSLADTAFAPLFRQNSVAQNQLSIIDPTSMPKVTAWGERLLALPEVRDSVVDEFDDLYLAAMKKNGSYSLYQLAA